jgi:hypothetical protein
MKLNSILKKHGIKGLMSQVSCKQKPLTPNNQSREDFSAFCRANGLEGVGNKNAFILNGNVYGFSLVTQGYSPECRQFGEDYSGLVCKFPNGSFKWFDRSELSLGKITRIGPCGTKYYNATKS